MKHITKIFGFISLIIFSSCIKQISKENKNNFKLEDNFEYVHLIPDSLRTTQQQKLCDLIQETVVHYLKVEKNHLVFGLSENDFIKSGIPKPYYDLLQNDLSNVNHLVDSLNIQGMDSILKESYKDLYIKFKK